MSFQTSIYQYKSESFLTLDSKPSINSNASFTFKAQKGSKDIIKIVHVTSVVQL